ncbi:unnamed protein product [Mytilus coruscus]|uniref:Uncharacterized protein n=1 Tax=Mytilus coruscus TaxID=42192 RepID=A0A6J8E361_MYTCO|nr:unnamed protein product [Mytilus coruscus]
MTVQHKMRQEIEDVVGSGRLPTLADKPKMKYCEAVIHETLRFGNIGPLSLPHLVSEEIVYNDLYIIPKGRRVCPGESLARMELFLYITSMVQRFEFLPVEGENPPQLIQ